MKLGDLTSWIEKIAPLKLQESYDNSGLIVGAPDKEVSIIVVCLDVDEKVMALAEKTHADMIISHHPCVFKPMKTFLPHTAEGKILFSAIKNDIAVYSCHTNFDSVQGGLGDLLCHEIGIGSVRVIKPHSELTPEHGLGRIGDLEFPIACGAFIQNLIRRLQLKTIREVGYRPESILSAAIFNGSFDRSILNELLRLKPDVLITGDLKYHDALELKYQGIYTLDIGHYKSEVIFVKQFSQRLEKAFPKLCINPYEGEDVFTVITSID